MSTRAERLSALLPEAGVDLLLVTNLVNVRYLTGYTGSNGLALIGPQTCVFVTDFRYVEQAAVEVDPAFDRVRAVQDLIDAIADALPPGELRLGFEDAQVTVRQHGRLRELLPERVELVAAGQLVERLRVVKEPEEVDRIRAATQLADAAFEQLLWGGLVGRTELELASVPHGALPHAQPRDVEIGRGELVVIDWGAEVDGYCSDCTRTVATSDPDASTREVYELVLQAQLAGLEAVRAGASGRAVDAVARAVIDAGGYGDHYGHGLGHGVGLEIHEGPRLSQRSEDVLESGNAVTVEPGIYLPGQFGVRIEDLVVVTDDGCEILTAVRKHLISTD